MAKERIEDRAVNYVEVCIYTESGCNVEDGEYSMRIISFIGTLDISSIGGVDDISLVKACIEENLDDLRLPEEGCAQVILKESGEWEDNHWLKYYELERVCAFEC